MSILFYAILLYFLYRFIFGFLVPVVRTTSQVKKQFNSMKDQMETNDSHRQEHRTAGDTSIKGVSQKPKYNIEGEYIPFEEDPK